jgi:hypothetical protein
MSAPQTHDPKWRNVRLARGVRADVVRGRPARLLLAHLLSYADGDGDAWVGIPTLAADMGYIALPDEMTESARVSVERLFLQLVKAGLVRRTPCPRPRACQLRHRLHLHFRLDIAALERAQRPESSRSKNATEARSKNATREAEARSKNATEGRSKNATRNTSSNTSRDNTSGNASQPPAGSVKARRAGASSGKSASPATFDSNTPAAAAETGDQHGYDDELTDITDA